MQGLAGDANGAVGAHGAGELAGSASDAKGLIDFRQKKIASEWPGIHRLRRTVLRTGRTVRALGKNNAEAFVKMSAPALRALFLIQRQRNEGIGRANLAADRAVVVAVTRRGNEPGLKDSCPAILKNARLQSLGRAIRDAKPAGRAAAEKLSATRSSRRHDGLHDIAPLVLSRLSMPHPLRCEQVFWEKHDRNSRS